MLCLVVVRPEEKVGENVSIAATTIPGQLSPVSPPPQPAHFFMRFVCSFNQNILASAFPVAELCGAPAILVKPCGVLVY